MKSPQKYVFGVALLVAFAVVAALAFRLGARQGGKTATPAAAQAAAGAKIDPASGRRVLYWHDPMVPGQKFDKPGKSPYMDMQLVPVFADEGGDTGGVSVSPRQVQSLGLRTVAVRRGSLHASVVASGSVDWNERGLVVVQARNTGYVDKLFVRATLDRVAKGQPLLQLYVPDWVAVQEEYLALRQMHGGDLAALLDGARARMRQAGMTEAMIAQVEKSGTVQARITLTAPVGGSVVELAAREGMTVAPGATLYRINALDSVWVNAELPESQVALVRQGTAVEARAAGYPETGFKGHVQAVLPEVDAATRTLKVRVELANPGGRLAPGMFVDLAFGTTSREALLLPAEAVIHTGQRSVVMLAEGAGKYRPAEVRTGEEADGKVEVLAGLKEGQEVVVSGQFLLDSEANLRAVGTRTEDAAKPASYETDAVFESLDGDLAMLSHPAIPALKWGAMTMGFGVPAGGWPKEVAPGSHVHVSFSLDKDGQPILTSVTAHARTGGAK